MGILSALAASKTGRNLGRSRNSPSLVPSRMRPLKPSVRMQRSSSCAAASGSFMATLARPAKRLGWVATAAANSSLTSQSKGVAGGGVEVVEAEGGEGE